MGASVKGEQEQGDTPILTGKPLQEKTTDAQSDNLAWSI